MDRRGAKRLAYAVAAEVLREYIASPMTDSPLGPRASERNQRRYLTALRELAAEMEERYRRALIGGGRSD